MSTLNAERIKEKENTRKKNMIKISILEILLAIWIASILQQCIEIIFSGKEIEINISFIYAVTQLIQEKINKMLFVILESLYALFLVQISNPYKEKIERVDTMFVTDDIEIPVPAGNGQYGNERFLREDEKEKLYAKTEWRGDTKKVNIPKGGIVVNMKKEGEKEIIYYIKQGYHTLIVAATGGGKTRRIMLPTMAMQILSGLSIVVSDVKGELYYYTSPFAKQTGYKTLSLDFRNPKKSIHYNFLQPILDEIKKGDDAKAIDYTWDLVSVLVGEQKGEAIWYNGECATLAAAILVLAIDAPEEYRNLTNVYYFLAYMCQPDEFGDMPINKYLEELDDTHPAKGVFAMATIAADKTRSSFFSSALGTLRLFTNPNIAEMTSKSDFKLQDVSKEKSILYMMIPDDKKTYYPLVSILITQLYSLQVELANENGGILPVQTDMDLDEVGNFPYIPVLPAIASAGRSRGVRANLIIQDLQQLESKYKDDYKNIMTNCKNKIYLLSDDQDTLKKFSENIGKYTVEATSASSSASGQMTGNNNSVSVSSSSQLTGRNLLEPSELQRFKNPWALCMLTGEYAAVNHLPDLSEYYFNEMFGLGDEEHNQKLIMEREAEREERIIPPIKLWGIWNKYKEIPDEPEEAKEKVSFLY